MTEKVPPSSDEIASAKRKKLAKSSSAPNKVNAPMDDVALPAKGVSEPQNVREEDVQIPDVDKDTLTQMLNAAIGPSNPMHRCGTVAIVGKPNVGKSTLLNALVGQKISITSRKAQTTRHRITGIKTIGDSQFVFVDTPGFQTRHSNALNRSLNKTVAGAVSGVDLILFVVQSGAFSVADAKVLDLLGVHTPIILISNKLDMIHRRGDLAPWLQDMQKRGTFIETVPMSAKNSKDVERLLTVCSKYLPQQAWWYAPDELTDRSERFLASEIIREKLFRLTGDELPYTSTVIIDTFTEEPGRTVARMVRIAATIVVERDGHKSMVIGENGDRLKRIGSEARQELENLMGAKVFLEIWVKVRSGWADDEARVRSFGYE
jgi:GTP-binding protein Era